MSAPTIPASDPDAPLEQARVSTIRVPARRSPSSLRRCGAVASVALRGQSEVGEPAVLTLRVLSEPAPQRTCYVLVDITERGA